MNDSFQSGSSSEEELNFNMPLSPTIKKVDNKTTEYVNLES